MDTHYTLRQTNSVSTTPCYPFDLHYIKALFLARQYKDCIRKCEEALFAGGNKIDTAHTVFLNFYSAMSHENLARLMHVYSVSELPAIYAAESAYLRALEASMHEEDVLEKESLASEPICSPDATRQEVAEPASARVRKTPQLIWPNSASTTLSSTAADAAGRRTSINFSWPRSPESDLSFEDPAPTKNPSCVLPGASNDTGSHRDIPSKCSDYAPLSPGPSIYISPGIKHNQDHNLNYSVHMRKVETQLRTHLRLVRMLKQEALSAQAQRIQRRSESLLSTPTKKHKTTIPHSRSFWSFKDPQADKAERAARIKEGKERGWARERFDADRYIQLAQNALMELGGERMMAELDDED